MISMSVACRLGVVADVGQTLNSSTTYQHLVASNPDAVLFIGDLAYADDYVSGLILSCTVPYTPISQRDKLSCFLSGICQQCGADVLQHAHVEEPTVRSPVSKPHCVICCVHEAMQHSASRNTFYPFKAPKHW